MPRHINLKTARALGITVPLPWPLTVGAQQLGTKVARIGLLMPVSAASAAQNVAALRRG